MEGYYRPSEIPPAPPVRAEEDAFSIPSRLQRRSDDRHRCPSIRHALRQSSRSSRLRGSTTPGGSPRRFLQRSQSLERENRPQ